ncbi:MAG TPA: arabinofuranosidase catalytic domain-containing protein [bacterium]|nr:arabinofuranosidase catalytic domain-containing protein [bacterium]HPN42021.1 arabinofuranosidase catalytic domain-containing protein [bacterium]
MKKKKSLVALLALAVILYIATNLVVARSVAATNAVPPRPTGPCDIYTAMGCPCVAAHSTTRALYASYNSPLYQVMRQSDGKTLDIGIVQPSEGDAGGYADAAAQDEFCANTTGWITIIYDQSGNGNHLVQAPRGGFSGPAMGGFNNIPIADMAPVTIMGHKVYGVFIEPGMGLRWNDAKGTAVDDQAEGQYWVISGHHYNSGCCFDYGNAETDSRDDGDGTMETTYYGNASWWYHGNPPGPWIMTDQENNLVGCVNQSPDDKLCPDLPNIPWRFVTATADGEPHHWRSMGGDAQQGSLDVMFDGPRIINDRNSYDPMRKQGAILLGNGGDNSNGSQGTFYEGAMTAAGTFPTEETNQRVQANIVAAAYDVPRLSIAPANAVTAPPGLQTFTPRSVQNTTVTFTNTTGAAVKDLTLSISAPNGWKSLVINSTEPLKKFAGSITPGASVSATFTITSGSESFNGDLVGKATWINSINGKTLSETAVEKVRNVAPVKINEFRISAGTNPTNSFIELYNASNDVIDISGWSLTQHQTQQPIFSSVKIPSGVKLTPRSFYLLGLANSGLAVQAEKGESTIYVRSTDGMSTGDIIEIGAGSAMESRKIVSVGTPAGVMPPRFPFGGGRPGGSRGPTTIWQPIPDGPVITIPAGSTNIPVTSVDDFVVGQKIGIGYGATYPTVAQAIEKYEVVTVTQVGKPGTQAWLSMDAQAGDTNIKVSSVANISVGDKIRLDIDSEGHGIETVTVTRVGTQSARSTFDGPLSETEDPGTGLDLAEPLKFNHASNMPFSVRGTGISFEPATAFAHSSNEPVLPLGTGITLEQPLTKHHEIDAVVRDVKVTNAGYQGTSTPNQWFGGPALSSSAGNMVLRDAAGNVADGLNYGGLVDPWAAEGYQGTSGENASGCFAPAPVAERGFGFGRLASSTVIMPDRSTGRFPDGLDNDSNCSDFMVQPVASLSVPAVANTNNIKVSGVAGFTAGQKIIIGSGAELETAIITQVGTPGATAVDSAACAGATIIHVTNPMSFSVGQSVIIDNGENQETAVIAAISFGRRGFGGPGSPTITVTKPLAIAHAVGVPVCGSGITLASPLKLKHDSGVPVAANIATPGAPNQYYK